MKRARGVMKLLQRPLVLVLVVSFAAAFVIASAALADNYRFRFNKSDQAAARAVILRASDLAKTGRTWTGGPTAPDLSPITGCRGYHPKVSDLVMTGAAKSRFSAGGFGITDSVEVLQNERMVGVDFRRTMAPGLLPCLRTLALSATQAGASAPPTKRLPFPHIGTFSAAFRVVVTPEPGASPLIVDMIIAARGRTEISLVVAGPGDLSTLEKALVRKLVGRVRA